MSRSYLSIPLRERLEAFKRNKREGKTALGGGWHDPPYTGGKNKSKWHWVPSSTVDQSGMRGGQPFKIDGSSTELTWCEDLAGYFREVGEAHKVVNLSHTGWYVDIHQDETCHGIVLQLPARDGKPVYLYGVADPWNANCGMVALSMNEWTDDKEEAARWADQMAEYYAESAREDDLKQRAEIEIEESQDRIKEIRTEVHEIIDDMRPHLQLPATKICSVVKEKIRDLLRERHSLYRRIEKLSDDPSILLH